ncbi:hypothetical protein BH20PSE1_BH20PSE1_13430 [soil metagenome]
MDGQTSILTIIVIGALVVICGIGLLGVMAALIFSDKFRKDMLAGEGEVGVGPVSVKGAAVLVLCGLLLWGLYYANDQSNLTDDLKQAREELKQVREELKQVTLAGRFDSYKEQIYVTYQDRKIDPGGSFTLPLRSTQKPQVISFESPHISPMTFTIMVKGMGKELEIVHSSFGDNPMTLKIEEGNARIPEPVIVDWKKQPTPPNDLTDQPKPSRHTNVESTPPFVGR